MATSRPGKGDLFPLKRTFARASVPVYLFHRLQELIRHPHARKRLSDVIARLRRGPRITVHSDSARTLYSDGMLMMPGYLSPERAAELRAVFQTMECRDPWKPESGTFALEDAPPGTHVADIIEAPLLRAAHEIAFDDRLLALAAEYFGSAPYVDSIQAWWSLPTEEEPEEAENFHRDNDSIRFLKFFLYLTDVDATQGPHKFVVGSQIEPVLIQRRRLADEEVASEFGGNRVVTVTGRAGDAFIEDTFGIHKGQQPTSGKRLLLQVRYSIMPTVFRSRLTVDVPPPAVHTRSISLIHDA